tara:strand:- start:311 stop:511 length:201 start_codon:yes stop_codon:yes gene_type:complete
MNLFNDKDGKFKRLEKNILDIEKEKHTISWAHTTIQSCLFKKHPEDVGTLHITENSMTFDFSKNKK